ncbi:MAG TPA: O-methyltransferase, partial [Candidatus Obscuribacterales bacterium]
MDQNLFAAVDHYIEELFVPADPVLEATLQSIREAGLPQMQVSPTQGKLLYLLARLTQARRILEIGTLAGYSSIWLARSLPADGRLITLEINSKHALLAWSNLSNAGLADKVEVLTGPALETLPELEARQDEPFDLVFLDADKPNYTAYLEAVLR